MRKKRKFTGNSVSGSTYTPRDGRAWGGVSNAQLEAARIVQDIRNEQFRSWLKTRPGYGYTPPRGDMFYPVQTPRPGGGLSVQPFNPATHPYIRVGGFIVDPTTGEIDESSRVRQNARDYRERSQPCEAAKESRRAAILNSGHGGRNGGRSYKPHSEC